MTASFISEPIPIPSEARSGRFDRADIVLEGLEQAGPSFEGHVFLNNSAADRHTERTPTAGYAGAFHVYGQGPVPPNAADGGAGVLAPITKHVIATDPVRAAIRKAGAVTVTIVPITRGPDDPSTLALERVSINFT